MKGFGHAAPPGGAKFCVLSYRAGRGRNAPPQRRLTIGKHGSPWVPEPARREAPRLLGAIAAGDDPLEDRKAAARTMTRAALCELYLAEGVGHKKSRMAAFLICSRFSTPRGRRSFGSFHAMHRRYPPGDDVCATSQQKTARTRSPRRSRQIDLRRGRKPREPLVKRVAAAPRQHSARTAAPGDRRGGPLAYACSAANN